MKEKIFSQEEHEEWLHFRRGKITGTRLKDVIVKRGTGKKIGFYELIAEKLGLPPENEENPMERGSLLEQEAISTFEEVVGKKVDTTKRIWMRDDDENIAISPDGVISKTEAVEVKCLSSARHIEAYLTKKVPSEYEYQVLQYFIVNDNLKKLHLVFFDPRFFAMKKKGLDFFEIVITRKELKEQIEEVLKYEREVIEEVNTIVNSLTF